VSNEQLDTTTHVWRRSSVIFEPVLEETVVLDPDADTYVRLNPSGRWLWERMSEPQTIHALARALATEFGVDETRALGDVRSFLQELARRRLVELAH
jgi:hypothetical protein